MVRNVGDAANDLEKEAVDFLSEAVAIRCEPEVGILEKEIVELYASRMSDYGLEVETFELEPDRPNVIGRVRGSDSGRSIAFNAHIMSPITIREDWDADPYEARVVDGKVYGSGVADAKAGIVAMILAAREVAKEDPQGDVIVALGAGGEFGGMIGTKAIIERGLRPDAAVVCEATSLDVWHRERGAIFLELVVRGKAGLTGYGINAIHPALDIAVDLKAMNQTLEDSQSDAPPDVGPGSINVNFMNGGTYYYNVPDRCVMYVGLV